MNTNIWSRRNVNVGGCSNNDPTEQKTLDESRRNKTGEARLEPYMKSWSSVVVVLSITGIVIVGS